MAKRRPVDPTIRRATALAIALALGGCAIPLCLNGSLDAKGNCSPVTQSAECVMKPAGERCLDTGTCNVKQECEVPGGPQPTPATGAPAASSSAGSSAAPTDAPPSPNPGGPPPSR